MSTTNSQQLFAAFIAEYRVYRSLADQGVKELTDAARQAARLHELESNPLSSLSESINARMIAVIRAEYQVRYDTLLSLVSQMSDTYHRMTVTVREGGNGGDKRDQYTSIITSICQSLAMRATLVDSLHSAPSDSQLTDVLVAAWLHDPFGPTDADINKLTLK